MALEARTELFDFGEQLSLVAAPELVHESAAYLVDEAGEHGEVFTRPWVVGLILDLVGYTPDRDLAACARRRACVRFRGVPRSRWWRG